jgi:anaerobic magnesium-protoporphyrin IX monomethyl ester cyclase
MKILMLNAPYYPKFSRSQRSPAVIKSGVMYYPIWLSYATGVLEQDGFTVRLVDAPADGHDLKYVLDFCEDFRPNLIVIDTSTPSINSDIRVAEAIRSKCKDLFVLLVGPHVTALPDESLRESKLINAVARGEYDYTVRDLARALEGGADLRTVLGLTYQDKNGEIITNPDRPLIQDLDSLPFVSEVYKRHLKVENYFYSITQYPEVAIITGRGCPYHCTYCVWPQTITGHGYRKRSIENVADEFEFIARDLPQVKEIFLEDDTLTVDQRRSIALSKELIRRGNKLSFTANSRADISYETLNQLHLAGLRLVCVGFESGDQHVLDNIKKKITIDQFYQFRDAARSANVLVHGCFMAGNPGDTLISLRKTLELAKSLNPDTAQFLPIMIYPGTEAFNWAQNNGYMLTEDYDQWLTQDGLHRSIVDRPGLTAEEIVNWCHVSRRSFYLRPRFIFGKFLEIISHPKEFRRIFKASKVFYKYLFQSPKLKKGVGVEGQARNVEEPT